MIETNYEKLSYILKNYQQIDSILLESLNYKSAIAKSLKDLRDYDFKYPEKNEEKIDRKTALQLALEEKNTKIINLLLIFMAKL